MARAKKPPKPEKTQRRLLDKKRVFLAAFAICGEIEGSAREVGINKSAHYDWLKKDPKYPERFAAAKLQADDALEDEATRRARVGVFEPTVFRGRFSYPQEVYEIMPAVPEIRDEAGNVTQFAVPAITGLRDVPGSSPIGVYKKSDFLLGLRLRAAKTEYRTSAVETTGKDGGPVQSEHRIVFVEPGKIPAGNTPAKK